MKAITYRAYGGPEVLQFGDVPDPKLAPDQVLIRARTAAINPADWKAQAGYLDAFVPTVFPVIPGWDVAGVVEQVGPAVTEFAPGDEVMAYVREDLLSRGTYAELVAAPIRGVAPKPRNLSFAEAAGLPLAGLTAYQALLQILRVRQGETLLVHAAAGAVGAMAVQIAHARNVRVIGTGSRPSHAYLRALGAEPITYGEGLAQRVAALAPDGVDAVLDLVGGDTLKLSAGLLSDGGRLASAADPAVISMGGRFVWVRPDPEDLGTVARMAEAGMISVNVVEAFPLHRAADAQRLNMLGHTHGKIVLIIE